MERGLEQFFILAVVIIAALFDLLMRWLKSKAGKDRPADAPAQADEMVFAEEDDTEPLERGRVEPRLPPAPLPPPRASPPSARLPGPLLPRASVPASAPPVARPSQPLPAVRKRRRRPDARHWLRHPADARRGIVLMAVLGPCRGLDDAPRGER